MVNLKGTEVSDDLNEVLTHLAGSIENETVETKGFLSPDEISMGFQMCTWYRGCYYCNSGGRWRLIYCMA